ncbi:MAG: hypothetical protein IH987_04950 [Planctomycetes bacterium]|nr:hypothetical protein [Planctomycetota bacterium]
MALMKPNSIRAVPEDLAFLAMTHHRLGDDKAAQKMLARLRSLLQEPRFRRSGEAMGFLREAEALIEIGNEPAVTAVSPVPAPLREAYNLDPFYEKYLDVGGVPILASREVSDDALLVARSIVRYMMSGHPELYEPLRQHKIRIAIIGANQATTDIPEHRDLPTANPETDWNRRARGFGATKQRPACSVGEENLLALEGDRYRGENILVHEFAHTMADMAVQKLDSEFVKKLEAAYSQAITNGLWRDTYAATNSSEYWAEGVQSWFDTNLENSKPDGTHNHVNTRDELRVYDAALAALIAEWLPDDDRRLRYPGF